MELQTEMITRLELKYCEQCGGLWLRVMGATGSYCPGCERGISQLPRRAADNRRSGGSGPRKRALQRAACSPHCEPTGRIAGLAGKPEARTV
jgi:hypothetical protein